MAWIESHTNLARHPKLIALRKKMRWSKFESVGFLHCLWHTVLEYAPNGVISALSPEVVAESLGMELAVYQQAFDAMLDVEVELLERRGKEVVLVHDWLDYAGRYLRDTKFKRRPDVYQEICALHGSSADSQPTNSRKSAVPTLPNQPTYQPPPGRGSELSLNRTEKRRRYVPPEER